MLTDWSGREGRRVREEGRMREVEKEGEKVGGRMKYGKERGGVERRKEVWV